MVWVLRAEYLPVQVGLSFRMHAILFGKHFRHSEDADSCRELSDDRY